MPIAFSCPSCERRIRVRDERAGTRGKCPKCKQPVDVPHESQPEPSSPKADAKHESEDVAVVFPGVDPEALVESREENDLALPPESGDDVEVAEAVDDDDDADANADDDVEVAEAVGDDDVEEAEAVEDEPPPPKPKPKPKPKQTSGRARRATRSNKKKSAASKPVAAEASGNGGASPFTMVAPPRGVQANGSGHDGSGDRVSSTADTQILNTLVAEDLKLPPVDESVLLERQKLQLERQKLELERQKLAVEAELGATTKRPVRPPRTPRDLTEPRNVKLVTKSPGTDPNRALLYLALAVVVGVMLYAFMAWGWEQLEKRRLLQAKAKAEREAQVQRQLAREAEERRRREAEARANAKQAPAQPEVDPAEQRRQALLELAKRDLLAAAGRLEKSHRLGDIRVAHDMIERALKRHETVKVDLARELTRARQARQAALDRFLEATAAEIVALLDEHRFSDADRLLADLKRYEGLLGAGLASFASQIQAAKDAFQADLKERQSELEKEAAAAAAQAARLEAAREEAIRQVKLDVVERFRDWIERRSPSKLDHRDCDANQMQECNRCGGDGTVTRQTVNGPIPITCTDCGGAGQEPCQAASCVQGYRSTGLRRAFYNFISPTARKRHDARDFYTAVARGGLLSAEIGGTPVISNVAAITRVDVRDREVEILSKVYYQGLPAATHFSSTWIREGRKYYLKTPWDGDNAEYLLPVEGGAEQAVGPVGADLTFEEVAVRIENMNANLEGLTQLQQEAAWERLRKSILGKRVSGIGAVVEVSRAFQGGAAAHIQLTERRWAMLISPPDQQKAMEALEKGQQVYFAGVLKSYSTGYRIELRLEDGRVDAAR